MAKPEQTPLTAHAQAELAQAARLWRTVADARWQDVTFWRERAELRRAENAELRWREAETRATALEQALPKQS